MGGHVKFGKNGVWEAEAFIGDKVSLSSGFTPAISLKKGLKVEVNLGQIPRDDGQQGPAGMFNQMGLPEEGYHPVQMFVTGEYTGAPATALSRSSTIDKSLRVDSESGQANPANRTASAPTVMITTEQQMALDTCDELERMLNSSSNTFTNQAKRDMVVRRIAELQAAAKGVAR